MSLHLSRLDSAIIRSAGNRHYRVLEFLGEGGFGKVFKAKRQDDGRMVAIKFPKEEVHVRQFVYELALCRRLAHRHIVTLLDWGEHFAVFELLSGRTLREQLIIGGAFDAASAGKPMLEVLDALAYLHAKGAVHCDVKPQNILLSRGGAKLLAFGSAIAAVPTANDMAGMPPATEGHLCSPAYSAPEQLLGARPNPRFDLYAWGLVWLECLSGKRVFTGTNLKQLYRQQVGGTEVQLPATLLGHPLGSLLRTVLHKDPCQRASDARQVYRQLQSIDLSEIPASARPADYRNVQFTQPAPVRSVVTG